MIYILMFLFSAMLISQACLLLAYFFVSIIPVSLFQEVLFTLLMFWLTASHFLLMLSFFAPLINDDLKVADYKKYTGVSFFNIFQFAVIQQLYSIKQILNFNFKFIPYSKIIKESK